MSELEAGNWGNTGGVTGTSGVRVVTVVRPTPAECVAMGGHCWLYQKETMERHCRHCGTHQRRKRQTPEFLAMLIAATDAERDALVYEDVP